MNVEGFVSDTVMAVRPDARRRGNCLWFDQTPLFVIVGPLLSADLLQDSIADAIDDGYGDPSDLDPRDDEQTSRLESSILDRLYDMSMEELLTVDYVGWPDGLQHSLCLCSLGGIELLVTHHSHEVPAFMAVALGSRDELLEQLVHDGDLLLPAIKPEDAEPVQVVVRTPLSWTPDDVLKCVHNLTGSSLHADQILGSEQLCAAAHLATSDEDPETGDEDGGRQYWLPPH
ncbi:hypothetical protein GC173_10490 [bacterium]|nr:hypothetical protein [bacterium]